MLILKWIEFETVEVNIDEPVVSYEIKLYHEYILKFII